MKHLAEQLLALTRDVVAAADTGDDDLCRRLLEERGRVTVELASARKGADATAVAAVSGILDQVRELDSELASRWNDERDRLGREMVRIRQSHTKKHDTEVSCIVNRRA